MDVADGTQGVLVVAEAPGGSMRASSQELFSVGRSLADNLQGSLTAVVVGHELGSAPADAAELGADRVLLADSPDLASFTVEGFATAIDAAINAGSPSLVLLAGTTSGRDVAPFLATGRQAPYLADCTQLSVEGGAVTAVRPVYQGKFLTEVHTERGGLTFATIRGGAFPVPERQSGRSAETSPLDLSLNPDSFRVTVKDLVQPPAGPTNLTAADVVVVGGRGLGEADNFKLVEEVAAALGGAVGATRAVTDLGWRPHYEQVGQTGKTISPQLYIGLAVSGAVQHTVGMRASDTIVAINRDADAPIFKLADFGIVGDVFEIAPLLAERLRAVTGK